MITSIYDAFTVNNNCFFNRIKLIKIFLLIHIPHARERNSIG